MKQENHHAVIYFVLGEPVSSKLTMLVNVEMASKPISPVPTFRVCPPPRPREVRLLVMSIPGFWNHVLADFHVLAVIGRYVDYRYARRFEPSS